MILRLYLCIGLAYLLSIPLALSVGSVGLDWGNLDDISKTILLDIRAPRIVMAILIGALLSSSGLVVQSVFVNPIADPYIIGIASSATFGAVLAYLLKMPDIYYGVFGFVCCVGFSLLIFSISKKQSITTLLIIGIAASSFLGAFTTFGIYLIGEDSFKIVAWLMGYLGGASWQQVLILLVPLIISLLYFYRKRFELNILLSGDDEAKSLGVNVAKCKKNLLIMTSFAVAFCVAFSGLIGFVGLIIPHTLRILLKTSNHAVLLPLSCLMGGAFLLVCDTFGRTILAPIEIPIGVITAFFGAPFFLYLAFYARTKQW
ncbi:iron ABC transporter permease [Helicobacter sp. 11S02596-1]|uniref:FecCD family ABC transporter permease n=1 Tax=Helicobacter sp. 11S02596-1 TaxID=1476194 RepID=UPI000BA63308|nr:iron ABC transporter permease [Helicobacter sp. 11S02596-1]PAF43176.1 iron ABC transporter [Helicobacter sp. 11S02596-1]